MTDPRGVLDLQKFAVKYFALDPLAVPMGPVVPVFHRWIQKHSVEGILIDVADYSHVAEGPGVVLVGHEADYSMDRTEGPLGLLYARKRPQEGSLADRLFAAFSSARTACQILESEPEFEGRLRFRSEDPLLVLNDRLLGANEEATYEALRSPLAEALERIYPGRKIEFARQPGDPRARLAVAIRAQGS